MNIDPASGSQYRLSENGTRHLSKCDEVSQDNPGRHVRFAIGDLRCLLNGGMPREIVRLAWALHCARNDQSPRAIRIEADLLDALDAHGIAAPLVTVDVCPACGQDLPRSEVEP